MIGRILPAGEGVAGLLRYLLGPGRRNEHVNPRIVAAWNGAPARLEPPRDASGRPDVTRLAGRMEQPLALLGDRAPGKPVFHLMCRCAPDDPDLPDRAFAAVAAEVMHRTGLSVRGLEHAGVRWVAVCHGDNHVHLMATLARQDGGLARLSRERIRVAEVMRWAEAARWTGDSAERARYRLQAAPRQDRTAAKRPTRAEVEKARRAGRPEPPRVTLRRTVQAAAAGAGTEAEFADRLAGAGVLVKWRPGAAGDRTGYSAGLPGDVTAARPGSPARQLYYSGGELAPDLTLPKLRARWPGPRLTGEAMAPGAARAVLAREVTLAARSARTEAEFEAALARAGLLVRWRPGPGPEAGRPGPGGRAGYAVSLPGPADEPGAAAWTGDADLGPHLALATMRARWATGQPGAAPGPGGLFDGTDRDEVYRHAAAVAERAARELPALRQPGQRADVARAAADVLTAAALATGNPALRQAADGFWRAAREPWGRIPARTPNGDVLRTAAWLLARCRSRPGESPGAGLLIALAALAVAVAVLRARQRRHHQAAAARVSAARITSAIPAPASAPLSAPSLASMSFPAQATTRPGPRRPGPRPAGQTGSSTRRRPRGRG